MDDLISRQSVIDLLKKSASRDIEEVVITEKHINLIKDMPCAYSVEKVVAELEKNCHIKYEQDDYGYCFDAGSYVYLSDAIGIVRKGGGMNE